jgi:hypothetical protein
MYSTTLRGSTRLMWAEPPSTPTLISGRAKVALSDAISTLHCEAMMNPAPIAGPLIAATTGTADSMTAR